MFRLYLSVSRTTDKRRGEVIGKENLIYCTDPSVCICVNLFPIIAWASFYEMLYKHCL